MCTYVVLVLKYYIIQGVHYNEQYIVSTRCISETGLVVYTSIVRHTFKRKQVLGAQISQAEGRQNLRAHLLSA